MIVMNNGMYWVIVATMLFSSMEFFDWNFMKSIWFMTFVVSTLMLISMTIGKVVKVNVVLSNDYKSIEIVENIKTPVMPEPVVVEPDMPTSKN